MKGFENLGLSDKFLKEIEAAGFAEPSEIQEKAIPLVLQGRDVIGNSATGSGKTLAFGSGIIEKAETGKGIQSLILTPTRELAEQIGKVLKKFSRFKGLNVSVIYGGVGIENQMRELRRAEIVVGTPGRILDHLERGTINLSEIKTFVLDEADRMLDMGFIEDVETIIKNCPKKRQTLLFSATIPAEIEDLASKYMENPEIVSAESYVDAKKLRQIYYDTPGNLKFSLLVHLLKRETSGLVMVFCNTRHNTDFVAQNLRNLRIDALAIHGGLTQQKRNRIMEKFHEKNVYVLVCTDVAARGLDIKGVSHVYNYDIPKTSSEYIHRIGRTARAGKEGIAINILSERDYDNFTSVLRDDSLKIEKETLPEDIEMVRFMVKKSFDGERRGNKWDSRAWKERKERREGRFGDRYGGERRHSAHGRSHMHGHRRQHGHRSGGHGRQEHSHRHGQRHGHRHARGKGRW
jgi:ATP-dependent RNA helicase DeaD